MFAMTYKLCAFSNFFACSFDTVKFFEDSRKLFVGECLLASLAAVLFAIILLSGFWG